MKKILFAAFGLLAAFACTKTEVKQDTPSEFMSITVQETGASSATVVFVPADNDEPYVYGVITRDEFDGGFTPSDVNDLSTCRRSVYSHTFEDLEPETGYVAYAYGVDGNGNYVDGRLETAEFTTLEKPAESTFGITVDNMTPGKVDVHIDTKDYSGAYFYGYLTKEEYDACADDKAVFDKIINRLIALNSNLIENGWTEADVIGAVLKAGSMDMSLSYLRPDTEYVFCVFGCNASKALLTEVSAAEFKVPAQDMVDDVQFTIADVDVTVTAQTLASVTYTVRAPEDYDGKFFVYSLDKSIYDMNSRSYTGEPLPIEEYCWYDFFDILNYFLAYADLNWVFTNAVWSGEITYQEDKARQQQDTIMYVYALPVDEQYCMPRQSKASVFEIVIPGYGGDL